MYEKKTRYSLKSDSMKSPTCTILYQTILATIHKSGLYDLTRMAFSQPLKYNINVLFYTKYTHPTLICRGTHARTDGRTDGRTHHACTENIYSIFRDKLLLLGEHGFLIWVLDVCVDEKGVRFTICSQLQSGSHRSIVLQGP